MAGMLAAPAVGLAVLIVRPRTLLPLEAAARLRRRARLRPHAVRDAADSRGVLPGDQRRRADRVPHEARVRRARSRKGTYDAFMYNFNRGQYGKPDLSRAPGAVRRAARHVVAVLQVAVAARRARRASVRRRRCSPRRSSCSGCSAAGCTSSATGEASGISAR